MIEERAVCDVRRDPTATEETSRVLPDSDISSSRPRGGGHGANSGHNSGAPARAAWCCYARTTLGPRGGMACVAIRQVRSFFNLEYSHMWGVGSCER